MFLGRVRRMDSGLDAYWEFDRALKELKGEPATKWQRFVAWTHLAKVHGLEWLGRGLEKSKAYAAIYEKCSTALAAHGGDGPEIVEEAVTGKKAKRGRRGG